MNWPPMLLELRMPCCGGFPFWLPWFLVYLIVLALMLVALPFVLLAAVFLLPMGKVRPLIFIFPYIWRVLFSMRGPEVDIRTIDSRITVNFV